MNRRLELTPPANQKEFLRSCARLNDFLRATADDITEWAEILDDLDGLPASVTGPVHEIARGVHKAADGVRIATMSLLAGSLVHDVETALQGMPEPPAAPTPLADLQAAKAAIDAAAHNTPETNRGIGVPDHIARPILALLAERGPAGARRVELVNAVGKSTSVVANWLAIMRDHGLIVAAGSTSAARYYLPEHTPTDPKGGNTP